MIVTVDMLLKSGACQYQVDIFAANFPRGARPTEKNLEKAEDHGATIVSFRG